MRSRRIKIALLAVTFVLMVWGFQALLFSHAPSLFRDGLEDLSFGWYVPLFSLYVLFVERDRLRASLGASSVVGLLATIPFLLLAFLGVRGIQVRFEMLALIGLLVTVPWALFGARTAKRVLFPALFLLFCLPLATFLDVITIHLRLFATGTAAAILKGVGADIVSQGTFLASADGSFSIDVAAPCSGLRSIFALMALTAGYAYFTQKTLLGRALLFACSVPLAIVGNIVRILTICLVGTYASKEFATGFYHDYSGYVVFLSAIALMIACGEGVTYLMKHLSAPKKKAETVETIPPATPMRADLPVAFLATLLVAAVMVILPLAPETVLADAPKVALVEMPGFVSETLPASEAETTTLPADTHIEKRLYTTSDGHFFAVSLVIGGASKNSIHRPELCLPAQGFAMTSPETRLVGARPWHFLVLSARTSTHRFAYTFFNQAGFSTASHISRIFRDILDRSLFCRIDRWAMVSVHTSVMDDARFEAFLLQLEEAMK